MTSIRDVTATHLATLNLFRNPDGSVNVTIFEARGARPEWKARPVTTGNLHAYVMQLVREAVVTDAQALLTQAYDRLFDMLLGDDGEAWSQAERFLKQHRPDLYNRIGLGMMPEPNPEPED